MYREHFQKSVDEETKWEEEEAGWIENFRKTERYRQLLEQYNSDSVEKAIVRMAQNRTRIYRRGPERLRLEGYKKNKELLPEVYIFFKAILNKKWFDIQLKWHARQIEVEGFHFPNQFRYCWEADIITHPMVSPVNLAEVEFLKALLQDPEYIQSRENARNIWFMDVETDLRDWHKTRDENELYPPRYPVLYRKYDEWFGQQHLLLLPQIRLEKYEVYQDVNSNIRNGGKPIENRYEGKHSLEEEKEEQLIEEWFRRYEPAEMNAWHQATHEIMFRPKATDWGDFYDAVAALVEHPVKLYPDGSLRWDLALLYAGTTLIFKKIADWLEFGFEQYEAGMRNGKNPLLENCREGMEKEWTERVYQKNVKELFEAQSFLNEPQTLIY